MKSFDVTGVVAGERAAIFIGKSAHVEEINIMHGAYLQGDIVSEWDIQNPLIQYGHPRTDLITNLTFGLKADELGKVTTDEQGKTVADSAFELRYDGNISGAKGMNFMLAGGTLSYNGKAEVINATVYAGGILMGNGEFILNKDSAYGGGVFRNEGTISPGNSIGRIVIDGDYTQAADGGLHMEFNATQTDAFVVKNGRVTATGGKLTFAALPDYYASGTARVLTDQELFEGSLSQTSNFSDLQLEAPHSPTLRTSFDKSGSAVAFSVQRAANAYSQYAVHKNGREVGQALVNIADQAQGDMRNLITALDFSAADGSGVRSGLRQLSPVAHAYAAQASAEANLMLGRMALGQLRTLTANTPATTARAESGEQRGLAAGSAAQNQPQWAAFVAPFASASSQQSHGSMPGYNSSQAGLMGGVYTQRDALSLGVYTAFARRQMDAWTAEKSQAQGTSLHLGGMATWKPAPTGWHAFAQMQIGVENTDTKRDVLIGSYSRHNKGFSTSFAGTAMLGGGWQWQVDSLTFGPYVGLEYALNMLPQTEEWGGQATRLNVEAFNRHDLRGVGGVNLAWSSALGNAEEDRKIKATLDAAWRQDLLNTEYTLRSSFVGYGNQRFDTTVQRQGQGSLGIMGSLQVDVRKDVTLGAHVQTEVLRQDYNSLGGGLSLRWEF